uniref:OSIGBa0144C23.5 protein n=1 Tax=Oryza sativa TaxID=4530 RepID=Q01KV2_ORYSA|nr:OSIGBa0144C23.5 [Oryza sativa]
MDNLDVLCIRFHFGGEFDYDGYSVVYNGGQTEMSYIERDKVALPEIRGYLGDHVSLSEEDEVIFHWLFPGAELNNGLKALSDDKECLYMAQCIIMGDVAEIYAEILKHNEDDNVVLSNGVSDDSDVEDDIEEEYDSHSDAEDSSETDGIAEDDEERSEDDEEAQENREHANKVKKNPCATITVTSDNVVLVSDSPNKQDDKGLDDDTDTPFLDSSEEASYDDAEDGEAIRRKSRFPKYDSKAHTPKFEIGMTFAGRAKFKEAVIKYGLVTNRHIRFPKDEAKKIRARCSWKDCPWFIFASNGTNCDWFQSNPSWKLQSLKKTVRLDMFADVSISKVKRAKGIVMRRIYDACRGEYSKVFEYQAEILRSNPGSTVAICLDHEYNWPVFQRMCVCFDACKKGFLAGCRKVIGLDGCFFKGACNGELLCALGRDPNNQMYPIAWAVVEKETKDTWSWFIGLLQKDLNIDPHGAGWVIISDQQKGLVSAVEEFLPQIEHRMCTRHIYANWRKKYRDQAFQKPFWKAKLAQLTPAGAKDMMSTEPMHWSRAWFRIGSNCDSVDNNMCESFNNWIIDIRAHPIISMFEGIRTKVQECSRPQKRFRPSVAAGTSQQKVHVQIDLPSQSSSLSITKKGQTMKVARTNTTKK